MTERSPLASTPPAAEPERELTEKQAEALAKVAAEYEDTRKKKQGYKYRLVTSGGESHFVATKIKA